MDLGEYDKTKKSVSTSRSFIKHVGVLDELSENIKIKEKKLNIKIVKNHLVNRFIDNINKKDCLWIVLII